MRTITDIINEASRNAKRRNLNIAKKMFINGRSFNNIMNFAILTAENPDSTEDTSTNNKKHMKALSNELKRAHYVFVRQDGHYGGNPEHSYIVFNVDVDVIAKLSGKFEQTSFFYCYPDGDGNMVNEYWEKKDTKAPYNSVKNPYVFINKTTKVNNEKDAEDFYSIIDHDYKYSIDPSVFSKVEDKLEEGLNNLRSQFNLVNESNDDLLDYIYNKTGMKAGAYRKVMFENITE
jgi:hypothetical protein